MTPAESLDLGRRTKRPPFTRRFWRRPGELLNWLVGGPSKRRVKVATSLRVLHEVLGLEYLHYGLWEGEALDLEGLKAAQARYSERLLGWIPEGVERILDVGAGVGTDALELSRRGHRVEGLSPDPYQRDQFVSRTGLPFHLSRFQDLAAGGTYDLILMSESAQYIWIDSLLAKARELAPGGYLLLADYFRIEDSGSTPTKGGHSLPEFERRARAAGFVIERQEDVTREVLPTLDLALRWNERYVDPMVEIVTSSIASRHPFLHRLGRRWIRRTLEKATDSWRVFDSEEFARSKRYLFMLLKSGAAGGVPGGLPGGLPGD